MFVAITRATVPEFTAGSIVVVVVVVPILLITLSPLLLMLFPARSLNSSVTEVVAGKVTSQEIDVPVILSVIGVGVPLSMVP